MNSISIRKFMGNPLKFIENTIEYNEPVNIITDDKNVVIISEEEYNSLMETLYLSSIPNLKKDILEGKNTKISDCISESEIDW